MTISLKSLICLNVAQRRDIIFKKNRRRIENSPVPNLLSSTDLPLYKVLSENIKLPVWKKRSTEGGKKKSTDVYLLSHRFSTVVSVSILPTKQHLSHSMYEMAPLPLPKPDSVPLYLVFYAPSFSLKVMSYSSLFADLFHSVHFWNAQCCPKHKSDPALCRSASEQVVSQIANRCGGQKIVKDVLICCIIWSIVIVAHIASHFLRTEHFVVKKMRLCHSCLTFDFQQCILARFYLNHYQTLVFAK